MPLELDQSEPNTVLEIIQPVYECSSLITYKSGASSAGTSVWSDSGEQMSNTFFVDPRAHPQSVHTPVLHGTLKPGGINLRQVGCKTDLKAHSVVSALPSDELDQPLIPDTIFAPQQSIRVIGVLPGATVKIYVFNDAVPRVPIEYGHAEAYSTEVFVPVDPVFLPSDPVFRPSWPYALKLSDTVVARQFFLCETQRVPSSKPSREEKPVNKGFLKANWSATSVRKIPPGNKPIPVLNLKVVDAESGACARGRMDSHILPNVGYMRPKSFDGTCQNLCDCDMLFTIPAGDTVSSLQITFVDIAGAYVEVSTTITVLEAEAAFANPGELEKSEL